MTSSDEFLHDPRRVMVAAHNRLMKYPGGPVRECQIRLLASGIAAMDRMAPELVALHQVFRMALVILGKEDQWREANRLKRSLRRLEDAYGL